MNNSSRTLRCDVMFRRKLVDVPATAQSLDQLHTARHLLHAEYDHRLGSPQFSFGAWVQFALLPFNWPYSSCATTLSIFACRRLPHVWSLHCKIGLCHFVVGQPS